MSQIKVRGLGGSGMHVVSLSSTEITLSDLFFKIQAFSGILPQNQIVLSPHHGTTLHWKDRAILLKECGIKHGSNIKLVRNFQTQAYPSTTVQLSVYKTKVLRYLSASLVTLSTVAFLARLVVSDETLAETFPATLSLLVWWPASYLLGFCGACTAVLDVGHWLAGFPIVPSAVFTLIDKGTKQIKAQAANASSVGALNSVELYLVKLLNHFVPSLVRESESMVARNAKGIQMLHENYGGTRVRFVCADGVAIDGMHISPLQGSHGKSGGSSRRGEKCYIVVNGNAEFYEMDGLYRELDVLVVLFIFLFPLCFVLGHSF